MKHLQLEQTYKIYRKLSFCFEEELNYNYFYILLIWQFVIAMNIAYFVFDYT